MYTVLSGLAIIILGLGFSSGTFKTRATWIKAKFTKAPPAPPTT